jgi:dihydrofolate reductase
MGSVVVDVSPSVDGFLAGPGVSVERPMGAAGLRLHRWIGLDGGRPDADDRAAAQAMFAHTGAVVIGRRMFDVGIRTWGADGAWGMPTFVVTHRLEPELVRGPTTFAFVGSLAAALAAARAVAGPRDVLIAGGAALVQQALAAGVVDALRLHVVPVLLGAGTRLFDGAPAGFELEPVSSMQSANANHLVFRVTTRAALQGVP